MKKFEMPEIDVCMMQVEDIITASNLNEDETERD